MQSAHPLGENDRHRTHVDRLEVEWLGVDPFEDQPPPRELFAAPTERDRLRDDERQRRRQLRKPPSLLQHVRRLTRSRGTMNGSFQLGSW
jgi:hypothetical protein